MAPPARRSWTRQDVYAQSQTPVIGDVVGCEWTGAPAECEHDQLEVVYVGNDTSFIRVVDAFGNLIAEAETNMSKTEGNLVLADVDGDGDAEVIGGSSRLQIIDIDPTTGVPSVRATTRPEWRVRQQQLPQRVRPRRRRHRRGR